MAKGDIINIIVDAAASASVTYQPAAGIEIILFHVSVGSTDATQNTLTYGLTNGTQKAGYSNIGVAASVGTSSFKLGLTNSIYGTFLNDATIRDLAISGVQVK